MSVYKIRCTNEEDFNILKDVAEYVNERTKVLTLNIDASHSLFPIVTKYIEAKTVNQEKKENLLIYNDAIYIKSNDSQIAEFVGSYAKNGLIKISVFNLKRVYMLVKYGVVKINKTFLQKFPPLTSNSLTTDLVSWFRKVNYRGKKFSLNENFDKVGLSKNSILISSCSFKNEVPTRKEYKFLEGVIVNYDSKLILFRDVNNNIYELEIKGYPYVFSKVNWNVETPVKIATLMTESTKIINPILIPNCLNIKNEEELNNFMYEGASVINRRVPVDLYNYVYYEIKLRNLMREINNE